jgi:hypothetical protein
MKVVAYPADIYGCGHHRVIWPCHVLQGLGHDIEIVVPKDRSVQLTMKGSEVIDASIPKDADVVIFQRTTHRGIPSLMDWCTKHGIASVLDIDDDLTSIHPSNPAAAAVHLKYLSGGKPDRRDSLKDVTHSWRYFEAACKHATIIQCATPELAKLYGRWRPARVVRNYIHSSYFINSHVDSDLIGWPASLHSHPNDPQVMGTTMRDLIIDGAQFVAMSAPEKLSEAFGVKTPIRTIMHTPLNRWPEVIASIGIGIIPLANSKFNRSKSWLKGLELCAAGVPWVASPRNEYKELHSYGVGLHNVGLLAANPTEWYAQLHKLRINKYMREDLSAAGRAVADTLSLDKNAYRFWDVWTEAKDLLERMS